MHKRNSLTLFIIIFIWLLVVFCNSEKNNSDEHLPFLNLNDTVKYVGMPTCRKCHENVYQRFIQTGMGQSIDTASVHKSSAEFDTHAVVYDSLKNLYYRPYWKNEKLFIEEFRLNGKDTVHKREEQVKYIIGSGQHTNSHLWEINGFIYQCPVTFYTQEEKWDLAPGFENRQNFRFDRIIGLECISCHDALPEFDFSSENKYLSLKNGIDCERCHGPGEIHVREKLAGNIVDTSKYTDFTIVNPENLSMELQMNLCQRCHLQGTTIINDGKTLFDFRPGKKLSEVFNVFLPRYEGADDKFIMASQADRLRMSKCFINSRNEETGKAGMSCITCHNPHLSVKFTPKEQFNNACKNCHTREDACTEKKNVRTKNGDNCVQCHLPKSKSIDIPHVKITDHYIRKKISTDEKEKIQKFIGLKCMTDENPSSLLMAKGYIAQYESYMPDKALLDSAEMFLNKTPSDTSMDFFKTQINLYFQKENYLKVMQIVPDKDFNKINDAWTYYRAGESYYQNKDYLNANKFYDKAASMKENNLDFQNKLASSYLSLQKTEKAKNIYEKILLKNPKYAIAWCNLGFTELNLGNFTKADECYDKAIALDPDYEQAWLNKAGLLLVLKKNNEAKNLLKKFLKIKPGSERAKYILANL